MHLASISAMIPRRFAYDRTNCARYLLWYLKSTISLSASRPQEVNEYLEKDGLSVQLGSVNKFGRIPVDQATEETAPGGTKGFSAQTRVVARYYFTPEYIRAYISELRNMTDDNKNSSDHLDLSRSEDLNNQRQ